MMKEIKSCIIARKAGDFIVITEGGLIVAQAGDFFEARNKAIHHGFEPLNQNSRAARTIYDKYRESRPNMVD